MIALSIGKANFDITVPVDQFPQENTKITVQEKIESSGGGAFNVAYLLGKWNVETYFAGTVGYDDYGTTIKKDLDGLGVHTTFLETNYEKKTATSFIINNKATTSRTQIRIEPEVYHMKKYEYDFMAGVIYSDGYEYSATMAAVNKFPNIPVILGAGLNYGDPKEIIALAKVAKYIVFSLEFAEELTKIKVNVEDPQSLLNIYKKLKETYINNEVIVTLKANGVLYAVDGNVQYMPTINVSEVDRTGAGDIFDGALTYAISKGYDIEKCMRIANIAAGLSTTKVGAKTSIPMLSEVISYYEGKFGPIDAVNQNLNPSTSQENVQNNVATAQTPSEPVNNNVQNAVPQSSVGSQVQDTSVPNQAQQVVQTPAQVNTVSAVNPSPAESQNPNS